MLGLVGILVPAVPGAWVVVAAILVWASEETTAVAWTVFGVAAGAVALSQVLKYTVPSGRMVGAGVHRSSIIVGSVLGMVGFFVVPVIGLILGFVVGVYAAERRRLKDRRAASLSTRSAVRAVGLSILIELCGALIAASTWVLGVLFTP